MPAIMEPNELVQTSRSFIAPRVLESSPVHVGAEASEYDDLVSRHTWLLNKPFVTLVAKTPLESGRVLDIGTGPGLIPVELARRKPGWDIWALDASPDLLERGRKLAEVAGVAERVHFVHGNATDLPFESGFFDLTISNYLLHHLDEPEEFFNEAARITRNGGHVIVKDLLRHPVWKIKLLLAISKHLLRYSSEQMRMAAESLAAGLTLDEVRSALRRSKLYLGKARTFHGLDFLITT